MRTAFTSFSRDFSRSVRPLLGPFDEALQAVDTVSDEELHTEILPDFREARDQLWVLLEKVESQQTYVMIFGPLKSGKSTLMNALAGAYVSEVTSLPAYPTVVFVSHSDTYSHRVTRYDGTVEEADNPDALHGLIEVAHGELAGAIREAERLGRCFDPMVDLPRTIKRIDVKLPAGELAASDTVLVDTPGLYTRMKFGYDAMTRDFRHAASIAIFVVRSDNIFLEQVFEEFTELLDLFSKVFLVLNFDSSKVDVDARGRLVPSLEQTEPERIVRAFEAYSMNARLKQAEKEGRLRIIPIDLLHSAAARLERAAAEDPEPHGVQDDSDAASSARRRSTRDDDDPAGRFIEFRDELTDFLDSNDHLNTFISDSLTRSGIILDQLEGASVHPAIRHFVKRLEDLVKARDEERRLLQATRDALDFDWAGALEHERAAAAPRAREGARLVGDALRSRVDRALNDWFDSDESLDRLVEGSLVPSLDNVRGKLHAFALDDLRRRIDECLPAMRLTDELRDAIDLLELDLAALGREALHEVENRPTNRPRIQWPLSTDDVPVKKRFWDWILFRNRDKVRERLLGAADQPTEKISPIHKARLLGDPARASMVDALEQSQEELIQATLAGLVRDVDAAFAAALEDRLRLVLAHREETLEPRVDELVREVESRRNVPLRLDAMRAALREARVALQVVRDRNTPSMDDIEIVPFRAEVLDDAEESGLDGRLEDEEGQTAPPAPVATPGDSAPHA